MASYASAIHIWDLRAIRARLKEMDLDWDWPEFPPGSPGDVANQPVTIEVVPGDRDKTVLTREQRARRAIERSRRAFEANPDSAPACNNLAWLLATAPGVLRNAAEAAELADKAIRLAPEDALFRNTQGVAYYRAGRYRDAVETLRTNLPRQEDRFLAFDLFFLAMSHQRLGDTERARDYYDWAVRWVRTRRDLGAGHLEELAAFRAEAEEVLGIEHKQD